MTEQALQIQSGFELSPNSWTQLKEQAAMLVKSGFLPPALNTPEKVIAVALKGKELGVPMMEALSKIDIIQGKPTVAPQLMLALALRTGQVEYHSMDSNDERAIFTIKRRGWSKEHTAEFGVKEATALNLMGKDNYRKQPRTMFEWRAVAKCLRFAFPDAISGLYTTEELGGEINDDGEVTSAQKPTVSMPREKPNTAEPARMDSLPEPIVQVETTATYSEDDHHESGGIANGLGQPDIPFDTPSDGLLKRFRATIREKDLHAKVKAWCETAYGKSSSKDLTASEIHAVLKLIETNAIRNDAPENV